MSRTSENALIRWCCLLFFVVACKFNEERKRVPSSAGLDKLQTGFLSTDTVNKSKVASATLADGKSACNFEFSDQPDWIRRPHDPFLAAMLLADMNLDGTNDLVLASGGDVREGHLTILYTARPGEVAPAPWISESTANYTGISVGDVNSDGRPDIVASIYDCPEIRGCKADELVAVQVFLTNGQTLPKSPQQQIKGFRSRGVDLGDVNGDGLLDIALAVIDFQPSKQRVYLNRGVDIDVQQPWISTSKHLGASVMLLDINLDGLLDALFTGQTPGWGAVFYGEVRGRKVFLSKQGDVFQWNSDRGTVLALQSDYFRSDLKSKSLQLSVAFSAHYCQESQCYAPIALANPTTQGLSWEGSTTGLAAVIRSADIDRDGDMDLVVGSWAEPKDRPKPGPVTIFCGKTGSNFDPERYDLGDGTPESCGQSSCAKSKDACPTCFLAQSLVLGNLEPDRLETRVYTETLPAGKTTISLPDRLVDRVLEVRRGNSPAKISQFRFVSGSNSVQVVSDFTQSQVVSICYQIVTSPDLFIADAADDDRIPVFAQIERKAGKPNEPDQHLNRNNGIGLKRSPKSCAEMYRQKSSSMN